MAFATLTRPILQRVAARRAPLEAIEAGAGGAVLEAPIGFGKTTLLATVLECEPGDAVWVRPERDPERGGRAGLQLGGRALGGTAPDDAFGALPDGCRVVVDDFDRLPEGSAARAWWIAAIEREGARLRFLVSTAGSIAELQPLHERGALQRVRTDLLVLRRDELGEIANARGVLGVPGEVLSRAYHCAGGSVATFSLLLEELRHGGRLPEVPLAPEAMLAWALARWYERLPDASRELLVALSPFPRIDADLARLVVPVTPDTSATSSLAVVEALADAALLVTRDRELAGAYRVHPLLRDELRRRGPECFGAEPWSERLRAIAAILDAEGHGAAARDARDAATSA